MNLTSMKIEYLKMKLNHRLHPNHFVSLARSLLKRHIHNRNHQVV